MPATAPSSEPVDVSVVIPVFDALPELHGTLDSALAPTTRIAAEVVAVDDGSTDGSDAVLDERAAASARAGAVPLVVEHIAPSGWAGRPRNVGVQRARGRYVFFCDADDQLFPGALEAMVAFADEHGSDVVVPKVVAPGRYVHTDVWQQTQVDADPALMYRTLIPAKLVRRDLIVEHGLRFAESRQPLEDGLFVAECYRAARRVSILADRDYYLHIRRPGGNHLTAQRRDAAAHLGAVARIIRVMRETVDDPELADRIAADLFRRKALKRTRPELWNHLSPDERVAWVTGGHELASTLPENTVELMPPRWRRRYRAVRAGSVDRVDAAVTLFEQRRAERRASALGDR